MSEQWMSTLGQGPHWSDWSETHTHCPSRTTRRDIEPLDHITWRQPTTACSLVARLLSTGCKHIGCQQMTLAVWMGYSTHSRVPPRNDARDNPLAHSHRARQKGVRVQQSRRLLVVVSISRAKDACYRTTKMHATQFKLIPAHSSSFQLIPAHSGSFQLVPIIVTRLSR